MNFRDMLTDEFPHDIVHPLTTVTLVASCAAGVGCTKHNRRRLMDTLRTAALAARVHIVSNQAAQ